MSNHPNVELLEYVTEALEELADRFVFLGGSTTTLLLTDPAAPPARASIDVDAIVRADNLADYHRLGKALRKKGFAEDTSDGAPVCRWRTEKVVFDVMPTDETILGFGNRWYEPAIETAGSYELPSGVRFAWPARHISWPRSWRPSMVGDMETTWPVRTWRTLSRYWMADPSWSTSSVPQTYQCADTSPRKSHTFWRSTAFAKRCRGTWKPLACHQVVPQRYSRGWAPLRRWREEGGPNGRLVSFQVS